MTGSSFGSWFFVAVLDLLATEPENGVTRREIKDAFFTNDPRLQLETNSLAGEGKPKKNLSTTVNAKLYKMLAGGLVQFEDKEPKSLDVYSLTDAGIEQQEYYKEHRNLIKPPRQSYTRKTHKKPPSVSTRFSNEAEALYAETMSMIGVCEDLEKALGKAEDLMVTVLAKLPDAVLHAHATPHTAMGQMATRNNKLISAFRRILLAMERVERTPQEPEKTTPPETTPQQQDIEDAE